MAVRQAIPALAAYRIDVVVCAAGASNHLATLSRLTSSPLTDDALSARYGLTLREIAVFAKLGVHSRAAVARLLHD